MTDGSLGSRSSRIWSEINARGARWLVRAAGHNDARRSPRAGLAMANGLARIHGPVGARQRIGRLVERKQLRRPRRGADREIRAGMGRGGAIDGGFQLARLALCI